MEDRVCVEQHLVPAIAALGGGLVGTDDAKYVWAIISQSPRRSSLCLRPNFSGIELACLLTLGPKLCSCQSPCCWRSPAHNSEPAGSSAWSKRLRRSRGIAASASCYAVFLLW